MTVFNTFLSIHEVAEVIPASYASVYKLIQEGELRQSSGSTGSADWEPRIHVRDLVTYLNRTRGVPVMVSIIRILRQRASKIVRHRRAR